MKMVMKTLKIVWSNFWVWGDVIFLRLNGKRPSSNKALSYFPCREVEYTCNYNVTHISAKAKLYTLIDVSPLNITFSAISMYYSPINQWQSKKVKKPLCSGSRPKYKRFSAGPCPVLSPSFMEICWYTIGRGWKHNLLGRYDNIMLSNSAAQQQLLSLWGLS